MKYEIRVGPIIISHDENGQHVKLDNFFYLIPKGERCKVGILEKYKQDKNLTKRDIPEHIAGILSLGPNFAMEVKLKIITKLTQI